jgi:glycosyltransferase involved in cell wall biosynthesis
MNKNPYISIIVPVFNGGDPFHVCVKSLLKIDFPQNKLQVILIDDGSTDNTTQWLYNQKLPLYFTIVTHNENMGRASARNSGLKIAKGDIIIFLDADMVVKPDFVEQHVMAILKPNVVAVSGHVIAKSEQKRTSLQRYLFRYRKRGAKQFGEYNPIPFNYLITNNMSVKRSVVDECGFFDETYMGYGGEDTDYAIRLWELYPNGLYFSFKAISVDCQNETLRDLQIKMKKYGSTNYLKLLNKYSKYKKALAGDWINSVKGKLVFNPIVNWFVKLVYFVSPVPYFVRYFIAYSLMMGARSPEEGIPNFHNK